METEENFIQDIYGEFKENWNGRSKIESIESEHDYDDVVNCLVDSVLSTLSDENDSDVYEIDREIVGSSQYAIYTRYHVDIYIFSGFDENDLHFDISIYEAIDNAITGFAISALEYSVINNE